MRRAWLAAALILAGCEPFGTILARNVEALVNGPRPVEDRITDPVRPEARLAVLWVGHATALVQIDDRFVLTDPVFTQTVGQMSARLVEPGLHHEDLPDVDAVLISHLHFDHLSLGSLDLIERRVGRLLVPRGGLVYVPNYGFSIDEVRRWETVRDDALEITAVPVRHEGYRYGVDAGWMDESYTGWVVRHRGITVYFGGDTAWDDRIFRDVAERFGPIDLALLPIGPVLPRDFTGDSHIDGVEAVRAFEQLGARWVIPVHYATFQHGSDPDGYALARFLEAARDAELDPERVRVLPIGGQVVLIER